MATSYYAVSECCSECGREKTDRLHIGASQLGWAFLFQAHEPNLVSYKDWRHWFEKNPKARIVDDYGNFQDIGVFWQKVESKKHDKKLKDEFAYKLNWKRHEYLDPDGYRFSVRNFGK